MDQAYLDQLKKRSSFYFVTGDVRTIASMLYGLTELANDIHFNIGADGVSFGEALHRNNLLVCGTLFAKQFDAYYHDGLQKEYVIFFHIQHMYRILSSADAEDLVIFSQDKDVKNKLLITFFRKGEGNMMFDYELTIMEPIEQERYEANIARVWYIMGVDTGDFVKYIHGFSSFDPEFHPRALVRISCTQESFELKMKGNDLSISEATITVSRNKKAIRPLKIASKRKAAVIDPNAAAAAAAVASDASASASTSTSTAAAPSSVLTDCAMVSAANREATRPPYEGYFRLRHLASVGKTLNQNKGFVKLYLTNDQPMVMELDVGTLGIQRITFMYCSPEDDDFDDEELHRNHFFDAHGNKREPKKPRKTLEEQLEAYKAYAAEEEEEYIKTNS